MTTESPHVAAEDKPHGGVVKLDDDPVAPVLAESLEAFRRDLPELLKTQRGKWVAHHGSQQIGIARTAAALYQRCFRQGLKEHEFLVSHISPEIPDHEITWSADF
jgi:hypothetical protein